MIEELKESKKLCILFKGSYFNGKDNLRISNNTSKLFINDLYVDNSFRLIKRSINEKESD
jgi:hypothetical protein